MHFHSLAGQSLFACGGPKNLGHLHSSVFSALYFGLGCFFQSLYLACTSFPFPLDKRSALAGWGSTVFPCRNVLLLFSRSQTDGFFPSVVNESVGRA